MECSVKVTVKWSGKEYVIELTDNDTIAELKNAIQKQTGVRPDRQKLLNLKYKGKTPDEECRICHLNLKPGFKLMMMGSLEEDIAEVNKAPLEMPEIVNDLDIEEEEVAIENQEVYLARIQKRIKEYEVKIINPPRQGKHLLVLDIDYTLFDHKSTAETGLELMRPYLHEFLTSAYEDYDIVIWSATGMKWIEEKMRLLGVSTHTDYKIMFYLDSLARISVYTPKYGIMDVSKMYTRTIMRMDKLSSFFNVKPLGVIWGKFPQYNSKNTIMFDDVRRNFIMNPKNGLQIRPFRQAHLNRSTDRELLLLSKYLKDLALHCNDFSAVNHRHWERYTPKRRNERRT